MSLHGSSSPSATALSTAVAMTTSAPVSLAVLSGLHHGVCAPIDSDVCMIGSSRNCDIVLSDEGIAEEHLQLRFYGRQVAINAIGGPVAVQGRPDVERGFGCRTQLPVTLGVGGAQIRIGLDGSRNLMTKRWAPQVAIVAVALIMTPFVAVQAGISGLLPQKVAAPDDRLIVGTVPTHREIPSDDEVIDSLTKQLAQAELDSLALNADGRRIQVTGQLAPEKMETWRGVQRWFDTAYGGRYVLTSSVAVAVVTAAPKFAFQAVFFGENPYVVDARGERRYPGAALQDGWMLKSIENGQILVMRGEQEFRLTL